MKLKPNENYSFNVKRTESLDSQVNIYQLPTTIDLERAATIFKSMTAFMKSRKVCLACDPSYFQDLFDHSPEVLDQWDPDKMINEGRTIFQSGNNSWRGLTVNQLSCSPGSFDKQRDSFELLYSGSKPKSDNFDKKSAFLIYQTNFERRGENFAAG